MFLPQHTFIGFRRASTGTEVFPPAVTFDLRKRYGLIAMVMG
jgi:hypothetical protein